MTYLLPGDCILVENPTDVFIDTCILAVLTDGQGHTAAGHISQPLEKVFPNPDKLYSPGLVLDRLLQIMTSIGISQEALKFAGVGGSTSYLGLANAMATASVVLDRELEAIPGLGGLLPSAAPYLLKIDPYLISGNKQGPETEGPKRVNVPLSF